MNKWQKIWIPAILLCFILRMFTAALAPLTDNSEGRYAAMCKNMAETGNFLEPMFYHNGVYQNFAGKPPFFFWCGGIGVKLFGPCEFAVRLPSILAAALTVLLAGLVLTRYRGKTAGTAGAFMLTACGFYYIFAGAVITDTILCLAIAGAILLYMVFLSETERKKKKTASLLMFALLGIGFLTKGPIAVALFGLPVFFWTLLNKKWATLKDHAWITGLLLFLLITVPWFAVMHRHDSGFLEYFFVNENFLRFVSHDYGDRYGAGRELHYGAAVWAFLLVNLPWVLTAAYAILRKETRPLLCKRPLIADPVDGLAFLGFAAPVIFWSLTSRLTISYLLPTAPMFAVWLAAKLFADPEKGKRFSGYIFIPGAVSVLIVTAGLILSIHYAPQTTRTTKKLIQDYQQMQLEQPEFANRKLYFVRGMPYSQNFYKRDLFIQHPKETVSESLENGTRQNSIFVAEPRQFKKIDSKKVNILRKSGGYIIFELKKIGK